MMKIKLTGVAAATLGMALFLGGCDKKNDNEAPPPPPAPAPSAPSESTAPPPATPDQGATPAPAPEKPADESTKKTPAS